MKRHIPENINFQKHGYENFKYHLKPLCLLLWLLDKFIINKHSICTGVSTCIYVFMYVYLCAFISINEGRTNRKKYSTLLPSRWIKQWNYSWKITRFFYFFTKKYCSLSCMKKNKIINHNLENSIKTAKATKYKF